MEKPPRPALAAYVIAEIRRLLPDNMELAKSIGPLLNLGNSNLYKRLRGEVAFSADELTTLARHFSISLDQFLLNRSGNARLYFPAMHTPVSSALTYLKQIRQHLILANHLPDARLFYATTEIPMFHYFKYPELTAFKLYIWQRTTWQDHGAKHAKCSFIQYPDAGEIRDLCAELLDLYAALESCEFWPVHLLENTCNQIEFLIYEGGFASDSPPAVLYRQLLNLVDWQQAMAESGRKPDSRGREQAPFTLYHNEIAHTNNTFLLKTPDYRQVFFTFDNPNYGTSVDPAFCDYTENWFAKLQRSSIRISQEGEKQRLRFFSALRRRMEQRLQEGGKAW